MTACSASTECGGTGASTAAKDCSRRVLAEPATGCLLFSDDPRYSRDGSRIVFVSSRPATRTRVATSTIHVIRPDGSGLGALGPGDDPQWSPDGRRILFTTVQGGNSEVEVMNADGSGRRNLTRNHAEDTTARWSPDGRRIFFVSTRAGSNTIFVMNADGSGQRRVSTIDAGYGDLAVAARR